MDAEDQAILAVLLVGFIGIITLSVLCCCGKIMLDNVLIGIKRVVYLAVFCVLAFCVSFTVYALLGNLDMNSLHSFLTMRNRIYYFCNSISLGWIIERLYIIFTKVLLLLGSKAFSQLSGW